MLLSYEPLLPFCRQSTLCLSVLRACIVLLVWQLAFGVLYSSF